MLNKLLKQDFRYFYKVWIVGAITSVILSFVCGACAEYTFGRAAVDPTVDTFASLGYTVSFLCIILTISAGYIIPFYRFYQNFYTDEGYLTFTLPATKHQHLLSKLLFCLTFIVATSVVLCIDIFVINVLEYGWEILEPAEFNLWNIVFGIETAVLVASMMVSLTLVMFIIISYVSKFSKKVQTIISVFVFYGAFMLFFMFIFGYFGLYGMTGISWSDLIPEQYADLTLALLLLSVDFLSVTAASALYLAEYRLLDRHLNLA